MSNVDLWDSLVAAEREVARLRAAVHDSDTQIATLTDALSPQASAWDQRTALNFLNVFPRDIPHFIPQLFGYALGGRWEGIARAILVAGPRQEVAPEVIRLTLAEFPSSDVHDYVQVAPLLAALEAGETLGKVAVGASNSENEEIRQVGTFILDRYRHFIRPEFGINLVMCGDREGRVRAGTGRPRARRGVIVQEFT